MAFLEGTDPTLGRLETVRGELLSRLRAVNAELEVLSAFSRGQVSFEGEARDQRERLRTLEVLPPSGPDALCPVCEAPLAEHATHASVLVSSLAELDDLLSSVARERPQLAEYRATLQSSRADLERELAANQNAIRSILRENERLERMKTLATRRAHVSGRASLYMESTGAEETPGADLSVEVARARALVEALEAELDDAALQEEIDSVLNRLGSRMTALATSLPLEHAGAPFRFDLQKLTVVVDTESGPVRLDEMGSGENWVGTHIVFHLALHEWFVKHNRPVPRFLFLDQPTQVYFPPDAGVEGTLQELEDEDDREAVSKMFRLMFDVAESLAPDFQIIVTDHADLVDEWYQDAVVERWRGGVRLIPAEWL
jgi:hypothetical protein